jgi:hypothetical protein
MLVGEQVLVHPRHIERLIIPNCDLLTVSAHPHEQFISGEPECASPFGFLLTIGRPISFECSDEDLAREDLWASISVVKR